MAERERIRSQAARDIGRIHACKNRKRRERCEKSLLEFAKSYFPKRFSSKFSKTHLNMIKMMQATILSGGLYAFAIPRGYGKTTLIEVAVLWALLYGHRRYIMIIGANSDAASEILDSIKIELETNQRLWADFGQVVVPIRNLERSAHRARGQTYQQKPTFISYGETKLVFPTIEGSIASGAIIQVAGIDGAIRGKKHTLASGQVIRPDLALIDDPQKDNASPAVTDKLERTIEGSVLGLAGHDKEIAAFMPCTVIREDDLADRFTDRERYPHWRGLRSSMMLKFPTNESLWNKYEELFRKSKKAGGEGAEATAFYVKNRKAMDRGAEVTWAEHYPRERASAIEHGMILKLTRPSTFWAEYQNDPAGGREEEDNEYELNSEHVRSKLSGLPRGLVPIFASRLTAMIDVQKRALYYLVLATDDRFTADVIDYGAFPDQKREYFTKTNLKRTLQREFPGRDLEGTVYIAVKTLLDTLGARRYKMAGGGEMGIELMFVDAQWGEVTEIVYQAAREYGSIVFPSHGHAVRASNKPYNEYEQRKGERLGDHWRLKRPTSRRPMIHVSYDTNHWKTFIARHFMIARGDPGALSVFGDKTNDHKMFGDHICCEKPVETEGRGRRVVEWIEPPGAENEYLDCLGGALVAASIRGASTANHLKKTNGDQPSARKTSSKKRKRVKPL